MFIHFYLQKAFNIKSTTLTIFNVHYHAKHIIIQQISRNFSSCKTDTLYLLNNNSSFTFLKHLKSIFYFLLEVYYFRAFIWVKSGLPTWHSDKGSACQCRRHRDLNLTLGQEDSLSRKWQLTFILSPQNSMDRGA